jgi:hypothetical protein
LRLCAISADKMTINNCQNGFGKGFAAIGKFNLGGK